TIIYSHLLLRYIRSPIIYILFPYTTLFRSVYTHNDSEEMQDLVKGLEDETGIDLNVLRTSSGEGWSRMQSEAPDFGADMQWGMLDRKSTRLNSSHVSISYAVFCLKKKKELI